MLEVVDRETATHFWNGIDPETGARRRRGDRDFAKAFSLGKSVEPAALIDLGAPATRLTGGYGFGNRLRGGATTWTKFINSIRPAISSPTATIAESVETISLLAEEAKRTKSPLSVSALVTIAFFIRPDLPFVILDQNSSWISRDVLNANIPIDRRLTPWLHAAMDLIPDKPPFTYPRLSYVSRAWFKRRCLYFALKRANDNRY